jgi:hypothetical protein
LIDVTTAVDVTTAEVKIQIPTWNLGERIPIAPQIWDADTPQIIEGTTDPRTWTSSR